MTRTVAAPLTLDPLEFAGHSPAELARRLRNAAMLMTSAELPTDERESILRRARGAVSGTLEKLDRLIAEVNTASQRRSTLEQLTETRETARIEPLP